MKCLLHIGTEKTGSTAIQGFLTDNAAQLSERGIHVCTSLGAGNNRALPSYFQTHLDDLSQRLKITTLEGQLSHFRPYIDAMRVEIEQARDHHEIFVITSEHCHSRLRSSEEVAALVAELKPLFSSIDVLCYVRPQAKLVQSNYSTWVEGGGGFSSLEEFCTEAQADNPYYNYKLLGDMWSRAVGKAHFNARIFNRNHLHEGDIRHDFLIEALGQPSPAPFDFAPQDANRSMGPIGIAIARTLNRIMPQFWLGGRRNRLRDAVMKLATLSGITRIGTQDFAQAKQIEARFKEPNLAFSKAYLERGDISNGDPFAAPKSH